MKLELELPDELVDELYKQSKAKSITPDAYAAELVYQMLASKSLGADASIENHPDWQAALERSKADLAAGRIVPHEEVEEWHKRHYVEAIAPSRSDRR